MRHNNRSGKVYSTILGFFLSILIFSCLTILGISMGAFRKDFILDKIRESNYYEESYKAFQGKTEHVLENTGISFSVIEEIYSQKRFHISQRNYVQSMLNMGGNTKYDNQIKEELQEQLEHFVIEKKLPISSEIKSGLSEITVRIHELYKEEIEIKFIKNMCEYRRLFMKIIGIALPCILAISIFIIVILWNIFKYKHRALRYVSYGTMGAVIMETAFVFLLLRNCKYNQDITESGYYKDFILLYTKGSIQALFYGVGMGILLFMILLILIRISKKNIMSGK